jgi:hypothetical protein
MAKTLWVVEVSFSGCWHPTTGYGFSREDGRRALQIWRINGSRNKYRLVQYGRIEK